MSERDNARRSRGGGARAIKQSGRGVISKNPTVARVLASLLRDGGSLAYASIAALGAPYFLRRKRRLLKKGRSASEFDRAHWTLDWNAKSDNAHGANLTGENASDANLSGANLSANDAATAGPRVAFVLASWGEVETMKPLIQALRRERAGVRVLISVENREAIAAARELGDEAVTPFPFDSPLPVARWHARARPDLVVLFEQFDFPTFTRNLWVQRVPFIVIQARVNDARGVGFKRRLSAPKFKRWQLHGLRAMLVSARAQRDLIAPVLPGEAELHVIGSLKFPHAKPQIAPEREAELRAWIEDATQGAPLLVAGSTHATEEAFVLDALEIVRENCSTRAPVILLAPRRLARVEEVVRLLTDRGITFSRRSQPISGPVEVLLLDTLGELNVAYGCGVATFVGGTINGASHNVAEPLVWGVSVAYGPIRGNFGVEQQLCENAGVGFRIESPGELAAHWTALLQSRELRDELSAKAVALVDSQSGAFARSLQTLINAVDEIGARQGVFYETF